MHFDEFVNDNNVQGFCNYLRQLISTQIEFTHNYTIIPRGRINPHWINYNNGSQFWECDSIKNAHDQYYWPWKNQNNQWVGNYEETSLELHRIRENLLNARAENQQENYLATCTNLLNWGGGYRLAHHNMRWMRGLGLNLFNTLNSIEEQFTNNAPDFANINDLRSNAGLTKIYSQVFSDFIIYDSRVAVSLRYHSLTHKSRLDWTLSLT